MVFNPNHPILPLNPNHPILPLFQFCSTVLIMCAGMLVHLCAGVSVHQCAGRICMPVCWRICAPVCWAYLYACVLAYLYACVLGVSVCLCVGVSVCRCAGVSLHQCAGCICMPVCWCICMPVCWCAHNIIYAEMPAYRLPAKCRCMLTHAHSHRPPPTTDTLAHPMCTFPEHCSTKEWLYSNKSPGFLDTAYQASHTRCVATPHLTPPSRTLFWIGTRWTRAMGMKHGLQVRDIVETRPMRDLSNCQQVCPRAVHTGSRRFHAATCTADTELML